MFKAFETKSTSLLILLLLTLAVLCLTSSPAQANEKINLMYLYGGDDYREQINKTNQSVNVVSPNYFDLDSKGNLLPTSKISPSFITTMHNQGIRVTPFLSNHWNRESGQLAIRNPEQLSEDILKNLLKYNLDGINIDIENLTFGDRDAFTKFISTLKKKLAPHNLTLSIAVGAIEKPSTTGWKSTFDLPKLSNHADYIIIMAYDEHWEGGVPGPVASLSWVQKCTEYMLTQIPKEKFILGVPFYGRMWTNDQNGKGLPYKDLMNKIKENKAEIHWDQKAKTPYAKYTNNKGEKIEAWFENAQSLKAKIELAPKYNIAGVAAWRLGQEDTSIWKDYSIWLAGTPFLDITNHWAKDNIIYLTEKGFIAGKDTQHFAPDSNITRAEAAALLSRVLKWPPSTYNPFSDVPSNHWALKPILSSYSSDVIRGTSSNSFSPNKNLSRAELTVILRRSFDLEDPNNLPNNFIDVPNDYWAYRDITTLKNLGLVAGRTQNEFYPNEAVTRAEFATMLTRILR